MSNEDAELIAITDRMYKLTTELVADGYKPFAVAAVHVMVALQIYKTALSDKEYNLMVDSISDSRNQIKSLAPMAIDSPARSFH